MLCFIWVYCNCWSGHGTIASLVRQNEFCQGLVGRRSVNSNVTPGRLNKRKAGKTVVWLVSRGGHEHHHSGPESHMPRRLLTKTISPHFFHFFFWRVVCTSPTYSKNLNFQKKLSYTQSGPVYYVLRRVSVKVGKMTPKFFNTHQMALHLSRIEYALLHTQ